MSRKLTLNLGLRYEYYPLMTRAGYGIEQLNPYTNQVALGGRGNTPENAGISVSKKLFAPRVGLAYRLDDNTVIRAGYGLNFDPIPFSRPLRGWYPLVINSAFTASGFGWATTFKQGVPNPVGPDLSSGVVPLPKDVSERSPWGYIHRGYVQSWNFTLEHKLPQNIVTSDRLCGIALRAPAGRLRHQRGFPGFRNRRPAVCRAVRPHHPHQHVGWLSEFELPFAPGRREPLLRQGPAVEGRLHLRQGHRLHR